MVNKLHKIGNGTGLVLDKATLELAGLREGDEVRVSVTSGSIVVTSANHVIEEGSFRSTARRVMDKRRNLLKRLA